MPALRIHYFQHVPFESPGHIEQWAKQRHHAQTLTRFYAGDGIPPIADIDWLIVMGGPMGVYDTARYPWLDNEKGFIRQCINEKKLVTGICLGAQLIAAALGAAVYPHISKEIGWYPVHLTEAGKADSIFSELPDTFTVLHWHGDTFDLPEGATLLASSSVCRNQAFLFKERTLGLQFHFETTPATLALMIENCRSELIPSATVQDADVIASGTGFIENDNAWLDQMLDKISLLTNRK
jgi:GMP synthase (glutamine-hydrolysing)